MQQLTNNFLTSDIKIASYLLSKNVSLLGADRSNNKKIVFIFAKDQDISSIVQDYWANKAIVNPKALFESMDYLKGIIYGDYEI